MLGPMPGTGGAFEGRGALTSTRISPAGTPPVGVGENPVGVLGLLRFLHPLEVGAQPVALHPHRAGEDYRWVVAALGVVGGHPQVPGAVLVPQAVERLLALLELLGAADGVEGAVGGRRRSRLHAGQGETAGQDQRFQRHALPPLLQTRTLRLPPPTATCNNFLAATAPAG